MGKKLDSRHFDDDELVDRVNDLFREWTGSHHMEETHVLAMELLVSHTVSMAATRTMTGDQMAQVLAFIFQVGFNMGKQDELFFNLVQGGSEAAWIAERKENGKSDSA